MHVATEFITAAELADRLRVRLDTIRRWTRDSTIPAIRVTGKVIRYDPVEVERVLRERNETRRVSREKGVPAR
jgi:excisionase family DNA binding protein